MTWVTVVAITVVALMLLVAGDRLLLKTEQRGWIYYRKSKPESGAGSAALGPVVDLFQPSREIAITEQRRETHRRHQVGSEGDENKDAASS